MTAAANTEPEKRDGEAQSEGLTSDKTQPQMSVSTDSTEVSQTSYR